MLTLKDIAILVDGSIIGDPNFVVKGACSIDNGQKYCITYLDNPKYVKYLNNTLASAVIISKDFDDDNLNKNFIKVDSPKIAFAKVLENLKRKNDHSHTVSESAFIHKSAKIGMNVHIEPNVVIEKNVEIKQNTIIKSGTIISEFCTIGRDTFIAPNVTIYPDSVIGNNVHIDAGSVIGADGFGWATLKKNHIKIPQIGNVVIEDDVWIGSNCCIDRATFDSTVIGSGTKMDNLIQIAHNVIIGKNCLIAGAVAIAGSTKIGNNVTIAGQVGIIDRVEVGDNTVIASKSAIFKSVKSGSFVSGIPARKHNDRIRQDVLISKLPEIYKKIRKIESLLDEK